MISFLKRHPLRPYLLALIIWTLIGGGVMLRSYQSDLFPIDNNDDGLFYVWAGTSMIQNPMQVRSHTIFDSGNEALLWRSQYQDYIPHLRFGMKITQPWFDHPPLGSFLIGIPAYLLGYTQVEQIPHLIVRYPAIIASIFTLLLTFLLAQKIFGTRTALFSLLFIATVPYFVFAHRQSYLENMLTPLFLGSMVSFLFYEEKSSRKFLYLSACFAFLCGWIKIPAFGVPLMFLGWAIYKNDKRAILTFVITFFASVGSYITYGLLADRHFFLETLSNQGVRGMYLSSFVYSFVKPIFYGEFMDGQYILGLLLCFAMLGKKDKTPKETFFSWFFMSFVLILFMVSGKNNNSAWYRYPLIPFMAIGLGAAANLLWEKRSIFLGTLFIIFGLSSFDLAGIEFSTSLLRLALLIILFPFVALFFFPKQKLVQKISHAGVIALLGTIVIGNVLAIQKYPYQRCQQEDCLLPTKIILDSTP